MELALTLTKNTTFGEHSLSIHFALLVTICKTRCRDVQLFNLVYAMHEERASKGASKVASKMHVKCNAVSIL